MTRQSLTIFPQGLGTADAAEIGALAERHGFDGVYVVEFGVFNDALATAQAIVHATRRIRVGTGIANLYVRHPGTLGANAVAIDEVSGGRFVLGIGASNPGVIEGLGYRWRDPVVALTDTTRWLRDVFDGASRPESPVPFRAAGHPIPIHWAGVSMRTIAAAGKLADGVMLYLSTPARYESAVERLRDGARRAGRDPDAVDVSLLVPAFLSDDTEAARAAAREFLTFYCTRPVYVRMFRDSGFEDEMAGVERAMAAQDTKAAADCISDALVDSVCIAGPTGRIRDRLAAIREGGVEHALLAPRPVGTDPKSAARAFIEAFAKPA